jgi:multiple sugar transport system permease protein
VSLGIVILYPILDAFYISFFRWNLLSFEKSFIGLKNYEGLFQDSIFKKALINTLYFSVISVPVTLFIALIIALMLNSLSTGIKNTLRTIYFIPVITSIVAVSFVWRWMFEPSYGPINHILGFLGIHGIGWLSDTKWALPAIMIVNIWRNIGFYMVIFLASLQMIPKEFLEAALIDGATSYKRFIYVVLPLLNPTVVFCLAISIIDALQIFTQVYVMTSGSGGIVPGGPLYSTTTIALYIYKIAFRDLEMGYATSVAFVLFLLIFIFTLIQIKFTERPFEY